MRWFVPSGPLPLLLVVGLALAFGACGGGGGGGTVTTATGQRGTPTLAETTVSRGGTAMPSPTSTPSATPTPPPTSTPTPVPTPTPTPCPSYALTPGVGALAANIGEAANRWNAYLGCSAFSLASSGGILVDFAPAEIQDIGWGQYSGGTIYLMPPSTPPGDDPSTPYANDFERLTCVVMHAMGHVLGYSDGSPTAPMIMRPLDWPTWPPTSCSTPDSP